MADTKADGKLALLGGQPAVQSEPGDVFKWPVITQEDEEAVLEVLRRGGMSGTDVTREFEREFAEWNGMPFGLGFNTGTGAIEAAMFGCKVGVGDEVIVPSITYWASALPAFNLGATVVFAEIDPETLCIDPADIEHRITERTKAIVPVHYAGYPCDMDAIMDIARRRGVKVIEDVSHAHGGLCKGRKTGTFGDAAAMSLMSGKSFPIGEGGMLLTRDREIHDRALAWGHYGRFKAEAVETDYLKPWAGLPLGGHKYRMHQLSSAVGRVQLKSYDARMAEIQKAMNLFWDLLDGVPGVKAHRPPKDSGSTMGGWYAPHGLYRPEELGGLSATRFCEAVQAEGVGSYPGLNKPLHLHPLFNDIDVYGHGKPTRIAHSDRDLRQPKGSLPVSEGIAGRVYNIPWFKRFNERVIQEHASAFRKVAENFESLLEDDPGDPEEMGGWGLFQRR